MPGVFVYQSQIIWANEERRTLPNAKELPESNYRRMPHSILQNMSQYAAHLPEESLSESDTDNSNVDTDDTNNISDTDSDSFFECVFGLSVEHQLSPMRS